MTPTRAGAFVRSFGSGASISPPNEPNTEQHALSAFGAEPNTEPNTEQPTEVESARSCRGRIEAIEEGGTDGT